MPPVPQLSPELTVLISANRAQAFARRQAKRLQQIRAVPLSIIPREEEDDTVTNYTVDLPGPITSGSGSSMRNRFCMGKTTAQQARSATGQTWTAPTAILASDLLDLPADRQMSPPSDPGALVPPASSRT